VISLLAFGGQNIASAAIVKTTERSVLYSKPSKSKGKKIARAKQGLKFKMIGKTKSGKWVKVRKGKWSGWLLSSDVEKLRVARKKKKVEEEEEEEEDEEEDEDFGSEEESDDDEGDDDDDYESSDSRDTKTSSKELNRLYFELDLRYGSVKGGPVFNIPTVFARSEYNILGGRIGVLKQYGMHHIGFGVDVYKLSGTANSGVKISLLELQPQLTYRYMFKVSSFHVGPEISLLYNIPRYSIDFSGSTTSDATAEPTAKQQYDEASKATLGGAVALKAMLPMSPNLNISGDVKYSYVQATKQGSNVKARPFVSVALGIAYFF